VKITALIASFGRDAILRDCISCIKPQVDNIVLVGSSEWTAQFGNREYNNTEKHIAKELGLIYVDHKNSPLGQKWQAGLNKCRELKPDAVLICGSDDLLASDWVEKSVESVEPFGHLSFLTGIQRWWAYNPIKHELIIIEYLTNMRIDPIGAGRLIGKEALDKVDWQIFPSEAIGCDLYSYHRLQKYSQYMDTRIKSVVLSVKGNWAMLDSWEQLLGAQTVDILYEPQPKRLLNKHFPNIDFEKYRR
jgi:glycosyltransferase involved in cell wall biosynthesis